MSRDCVSLVKAFIVYVRPLLEYNCSIWSPRYIQDINCVEAVQRRFTKRLPGMQNLTYLARLKKLNLESLEIRRVRADLILMYKIMFCLIDVSVSDFLYWMLAEIIELGVLMDIKSCNQLILVLLEPRFSVIVLLMHGTVCRVQLIFRHCHYSENRLIILTWLSFAKLILFNIIDSLTFYSSSSCIIYCYTECHMALWFIKIWFFLTRQHTAPLTTTQSTK